MASCRFRDTDHNRIVLSSPHVMYRSGLVGCGDRPHSSSLQCAVDSCTMRPVNRLISYTSDDLVPTRTVERRRSIMNVTDRTDRLYGLGFALFRSNWLTRVRSAPLPHTFTLPSLQPDTRKSPVECREFTVFSCAAVGWWVVKNKPGNPIQTQR